MDDIEGDSLAGERFVEAFPQVIEREITFIDPVSENTEQKRMEMVLLEVPPADEKSDDPSVCEGRIVSYAYIGEVWYRDKKGFDAKTVMVTDYNGEQHCFILPDFLTRGIIEVGFFLSSTGACDFVFAAGPHYDMVLQREVMDECSEQDH